MRYNIEFYEKENGTCEIWDYLETLRRRSPTNKDSRVQYKSISLHIQLLQDNGTLLPANITKHIGEDLWELRPGNNRIIYFFFEEDTYVLLHHFRKTTKKTPRREIERAKANKDDYIRRRKVRNNENLG